MAATRRAFEPIIIGMVFLIDNYNFLCSPFMVEVVAHRGLTV